MASSSSNNNAQSSKNQEEEEKHWILHTRASYILLLLVLLVAFACLLIWVKVHPNTLRFAVDNAVVHDFSVFSVYLPHKNTTEDRLSATFLMSFSTHNLNHEVNISYKRLIMEVECYGQVVASGTVQSFVQEKGTVRGFNLTVYAQNVPLSVPTAIKLKKIKKPLDTIKVDVKMHAKAIFMVSHWKDDQRKLKIMCRAVAMHFSSSTPFETKRCNVEL